MRILAYFRATARTNTRVMAANLVIFCVKTTYFLSKTNNFLYLRLAFQPLFTRGKECCELKLKQ